VCASYSSSPGHVGRSLVRDAQCPDVVTASNPGMISSATAARRRRKDNYRSTREARCDSQATLCASRSSSHWAAVDRERRAHPVFARGGVGIATQPTSTSPSSSASDPHYRVFVVYLWHGQCVTRRQASTAASWIGMASRSRSRLISALRVRTQSARRYRSPRSHPASTWSHSFRAQKPPRIARTSRSG